ncbi:YitT family protein [Flavobacterium orientale]|uniref:Membrane protein n=1 Tax=Flavobacterium orientale TaxID=1756020 RepID=A0A916XZG1_9FLAO|nr:YitT family protein [Flavobacterium orientale]GGD23531.1 membrane protein [Flavobacterium orientale]
MKTNSSFKYHTIDFIYILLGAWVSGFALRGFLVPNHFFDGGVTGISLLVHEIKHWNIALVIILANIPFILVGSRIMSKVFVIRSIVGVVLLGLFLAFFPYPEFFYDKLLISTFGGVFLGVGIGLGMRGGCALDGIEILAVYTLRRTSFSMSEVILGINVLIFLSAAHFIGFETALYAILTYYMVTKATEYVVNGLEEFTGVTIISGESEAIKSVLVNKLDKGITVYKGERGYLKDNFHEHNDCDIIYTVVTRLEVRRLKNEIKNIDPKAFVFTNTIKETVGGILKRHADH